MATIEKRIRQHYTQLPPQERRLADFIISHPHDLALLNSAELAQVCSISKATVSRLFQRLGFSSFKEGRLEARTLRQQGVPVLTTGSPHETIEHHFEREIANLTSLSQSLSPQVIESVVEALAKAGSISVIGYRNSYPVAMHIRQQLMQIRGQVSLSPLPGQTIGEDLVGLSPQDVVILVGFRRRPHVFKALIDLIVAEKIPVLLLGDLSLRPLADKATWWIECPLDSVSAFDTYSTAMSVSNLLANSLLHHQSSSGENRISRIRENYSQLNELDLN